MVFLLLKRTGGREVGSFPTCCQPSKEANASTSRGKAPARAERKVLPRPYFSISQVCFAKIKPFNLPPLFTSPNSFTLHGQLSSISYCSPQPNQYGFKKLRLAFQDRDLSRYGCSRRHHRRGPVQDCQFQDAFSRH